MSFCHVEIERRFDANFVNRVANHPEVAPNIRGWLIGKLDFSAQAANRANVFLTGEHGVMIFHRHQPGIFECHTMVLPRGRGRWTLRFVHACLHWMFTRTEVIEVMTRVPKGNLAAFGLVRAIKGVYQFTNPRGWVIDGDPVPADIYSMDIQSWIRNADGLRERGEWFREKLNQEMSNFGMPKDTACDEMRDRNMGAACEIIFGGQPHKGVVFYNRFASMADQPTASVIGADPLAIDIGFGVIVMRDGDFWLASASAAA